MEKTSNWLGPIMAKTPDIVHDINQIFGTEISSNTFDKIPEERRKIITRLAERIEYISHLIVISNIIESITEKTTTSKQIEQNKSMITQHYKLIYNGHDLSGAHLDIEAQIFYLLLTCVDTIKGQEQYRSSFQWMLKNKSDKLMNLNNIKQLASVLNDAEEEYQSEYGLRKNFLAAFTNDLSDPLKDQLTGSLIIVKIEKGEILESSYNKWMKYSQHTQLKRIADKLYDIRSIFTHKSVRSFLPRFPIEHLLLENREYLLCKSQTNFIIMLKKSIVNLVRNLLLDINNPDQ